MIRRITYLLPVKASRPADTAEGMPVKAMTQDMMEDVAIRKMMMPVISAESRRIFGISLTLIVR